jgi:hypothetical protein
MRSHAQRQRTLLPGRRPSSPASQPPLQALTPSPVVGRALLRLRILRGAARVDSGLERIAGLLGSTGAKRPCVF